MDLSKINFDLLPKSFCEGAVINHGEHAFVFAFNSGQQITCFVTTPQVMKSIVGVFMEQISKYEKQFQEIDMKQPMIQSPIQLSDLQNPDKGSSDK